MVGVALTNVHFSSRKYNQCVAKHMPVPEEHWQKITEGVRRRDQGVGPESINSAR